MSRDVILTLEVNMYANEDELPRRDSNRIGVVYPATVILAHLGEADKSRGRILGLLVEGLTADLGDGQDPDLWGDAVRRLKERCAVLDAPPVEKAATPEPE